MNVTISTLIYENLDKFYNLIYNIILPTTQHYKNFNFEVIVADNSSKPTHLDLPLPFTYLWFGGRNEQYAGALNKVVSLAAHPFLVYLCSNHCQMNDPTWLEDIVAPLADRQTAMAGHVVPSDLSFIKLTGFDEHVQGGIFAAKTSLLGLIPYNLEYRHLYSDIWLCYKLKRLGFNLASVPTVCSVWRRKIPNPNRYKLIHHEG